MKIALFGKKINKDLINVFSYILKELHHHQFEVAIYEPFFKDICKSLPVDKHYTLFSTHEELVAHSEIVISLGGDGTLLDLVVLVRDSLIPVLGVNIGRLGFLPTTSVEEFDDALTKLQRKEYTIETRSLLKVNTNDNIFGNLNYALNDITVLTKYPARMLAIEAWVDDYFLNNYWGDGLIIATPTGSTAYSMSCGGDILTPSSKNFIITPIAPHNLTVRSLIISEESKIRIRVQGSPFENYLVALDARTKVIEFPIDIYIEKEKFGFNLIRMEGNDFYQTLRTKLNWGLDRRN